MSAHVWALLVVRRIACDLPDLIRAHSDRLEAIVGNALFPHVLIRELARSTLIAVGTGPEGLEVLNQPKACHVERRHGYSRSGLHDRPERFRIDSMDVIPYWYDPLGRVFDLAGGEIADRATRWIVDEWNFDDDAVLAVDLELRQRRGYDDLYKHHGTNTKLEDLSSYLEWHAMFLVAGELVDDSSYPIVVPDYEDVEDPRMEWLGRYLNPTDGYRIGDLRSAVPLQPWLHVLDRGEGNWRTCEDADFEREVIDGDDIVVSANIEVSHGTVYSGVMVSSALVAQETATALLRSLQDVADFRAYALPDANDHYSRQFDSDEFILRGWLDDYMRETTGLEKHDEARRIDLSHARPSSRFEAWANVPVANPWLLRCVPCRLVKWSDELPNTDRRTRSSHSVGYRLSIARSDLLSYLTFEQMALVLEVSITRNFDDSSH